MNKIESSDDHTNKNDKTDYEELKKQAPFYIWEIQAFNSSYNEILTIIHRHWLLKEITGTKEEKRHMK